MAYPLFFRKRPFQIKRIAVCETLDFRRLKSCVDNNNILKYSTYVHCRGVKTREDDAMNGSRAMGRTRLMALARMYTTPRLPQRDPKIAMDLETGHLDSVGSAANKSCVVLDFVAPPRKLRTS